METHNFVLRLFSGVGKESLGQTEEAHQAMVDTILDTLRREQTLQLAGTATFVGPAALRITDVRMFSDYLAHYAEIVLPVTAHLGSDV
jgi:hypothetical protein